MNQVKRRDAWASTGRQPQRRQQLRIIVQPFSALLRHGRLAARTAQQHYHRLLEQRHQRDRLMTRPPAIRPTRVRHRRQCLGQRSRCRCLDHRHHLPLLKHDPTPHTSDSRLHYLITSSGENALS